MPCHHDFLKMSHYRANAKYGEKQVLFNRKIIFRPKIVVMSLYRATFTNLTLNDIQKEVFCLFFYECPTIAHLNGGTYLKLANKIQKILEEVTSLTKTSSICSN